MAELKEITDQNYKKEVIESEDIWAISFSALSYCAPCKALHEVLKHITANDKVPNVKFGTVAIEDTGLNWSTEMGIKAAPTTHVMRGSKILGTILGFQGEKEFIEKVQSFAELS
jgi:thioredoxin-like negative regulator of GroEL